MFKQADKRWDNRFKEADERWETRFSKLRKELKDDIETAVAQVIDTMIKFTASKEDLKRVEDRLANVEIEVKDVKRSINDLKADIPSPQEFTAHEKRIGRLEKTVFAST